MRYGKEGQGRTGTTVGVKIKVCDIVYKVRKDEDKED